MPGENITSFEDTLLLPYPESKFTINEFGLIHISSFLDNTIYKPPRCYISAKIEECVFKNINYLLPKIELT